MTAAIGITAAFDHGLRGKHCWLEVESGERFELPIGQWHSEGPDAGDELMLTRCTGPTIDIGCGPGRLAAALTQRGIAALGIDTSQVAVDLATLRGAPAVRHDVFATLPGASSWEHALLADGNIGIGGDPHILLHRVQALLCPTGTALVEVEPHGRPLRSEFVRVAGHGSSSGWFRWAWIGTDALPTVARDAGMRVTWLGTHNGRWFAELIADYLPTDT